jgi:hypothetical protein
MLKYMKETTLTANEQTGNLGRGVEILKKKTKKTIII